MLVLHALTGDSHVVGPAGPGHPTAGWWDGPGRAGPAARHRPLVRRRAERARRLPGHHRTVVDRPRRPPVRSAASPYLTVRDQVRRRGRARRPARHRPPGPRWSAARWAACGRWSGRSPTPSGWQRLLVLASTAASTGDQIAWCAPQLAAIRADPGFARRRLLRRRTGGGPLPGWAIARRIAHTTYRSGDGAGPPLRPHRAGGREPARGRWALRRRVLPRPPRRQAGAAASTPTPTWC